jgi:hypothetical protein
VVSSAGRDRARSRSGEAREGEERAAHFEAARDLKGLEREPNARLTARVGAQVEVSCSDERRLAQARRRKAPAKVARRVKAG